MLTPDSAEEFNGDCDDMSCMTRDTGIIGTSFRHAVDEVKNELKKNIHMPPWGISKTIWMQYVMNQVSGKILNIVILPMVLGERGWNLSRSTRKK